MKQTLIDFTCGCETDKDFTPNSCRLCCHKITQIPIPNFDCICDVTSTSEGRLTVRINEACPRIIQHNQSLPDTE
jgi:hypothetical protein